jgi:predicted transposase YdaD
MIDHDQLFKKLLENFFPEFIELFFPDISNYWQPETIEFLPQEVFTDVTAGEKKIADLVVRVSFRDREVIPKEYRDSLFIIHLEHQSSSQADFNARMFTYFARLHEKYGLPIYPIVLYSHDSPRTPEPTTYTVDFPGWKVLEFNYRVIQLNQLNWHDFVSIPNPVASALIAKMRMDKQERPTVKLSSLQLLVSLGLNPAQIELISQFIDVYLELNTQEEAIFKTQLATIEPVQEEEVMEIVTSWQRQGRAEGRAEGREQGRQQEACTMVLRQLNRRIGALTTQLQERIQQLSTPQLEDLGEALLDFSAIADLENWLLANKNRE